jgi:hypothetical protein
MSRRGSRVRLPPEELPEEYRAEAIKRLIEEYGEEAVIEAIVEKHGLTSRSGSRESTPSGSWLVPMAVTTRGEPVYEWSPRIGDSGINWLGSRTPTPRGHNSNRAATAIQRLARGFLGRKKTQKLLEKKKRKTEMTRRERELERLNRDRQKAELLQRLYRGHSERKEIHKDKKIFADLNERLAYVRQIVSQNDMTIWDAKRSELIKHYLYDDLIHKITAHLKSPDIKSKKAFNELLVRAKAAKQKYEDDLAEHRMERIKFIEDAIDTHKDNPNWLEDFKEELKIQGAHSTGIKSKFIQALEETGRSKGRGGQSRGTRAPVPSILGAVNAYRGNDKNPDVNILYKTLFYEEKGRKNAGKKGRTLPKNAYFLHQGGGGRTRRRASHKRKPTRKNIPVRGFAVVQSTEKPWVKESNYRRWVAKLRRHTAKVKKHGEVEHPDNMCVDSEICKGDLGIPRSLMPQFTSPKDIQSFTRFAEKKYGIKSKRSTRKAGQLRPSQEEINRERVEDVADDIRHKKLDPKVPLIVSSDNFVIDGHHRWAAYRVDHPTTQMPVLVVDAPARDVLSVAATWGAKHHQF